MAPATAGQTMHPGLTHKLDFEPGRLHGAKGRNSCNKETASRTPPGLSLNKWMHIYNGNILGRRKELVLAAWNCGGGYLSKGKKFEVEAYLKANDCDLFAVSEVEITNTDFYYDQLYQIKGYTMHFPPSWQRKGKTRILLYVKSHLEMHIKLRPDLSPDYQPVIWVQINTAPSLFVAFIYREWSDEKGDRTVAAQQFRLGEFLNKARRVSHRETIWLGDMNIQASKLDSDEEQGVAATLKEYMLEEGLEQMINKPTRSRVVKDTLQESTIDLILSNKPEKVENIQIHPTSNSDHSIISFRRKTIKNFKPEPITVRSFKNFNAQDFEDDLKDTDWTFANKSVDQAVALLNEKILTCLDKHAPMVTFTPKTKHNPLLSKETIDLIRTRNKASEKAKKTRDPADVENWRKIRNKVVGMINKDKKAADKLDFSNPKKAWDAFNTLRRANKTGEPKEIKVKGKITSNKQEMAEAFNDFFISKVEKLKSKTVERQKPYDPVDHLMRYLPKNLPTFSLRKVSPSETEEVLKQAKNTRSMGPDNISYFVLKAAMGVLKVPLTNIFNLSLETGSFPSIWKTCSILALHKKDSKMEMANFRNINLVPKAGLIFEKLIHKQIAAHFTNHNLFSRNQHAYIQGRSTSTLCATVYDRCCRAAQLGKFAGILSCDLKAGFDLVHGGILTRKLECFNTSRETLRWFSSYLSERHQSVMIGGARSQVKKGASSLGQGTILAPILFAIAISDLPQAVEEAPNPRGLGEADNGHIDIFADDVQDIVVDKNPVAVVARLQQDAERIEDWLCANELALAETKTTLLLATNKEKQRDVITNSLGLVMGGKAIKQSNSIVLLGVTLHKDLTFGAHIHGVNDEPADKGLLKKLSGLLGVVSRIQNCPAKAKLMFLSATFNSKLSYCIETWGSIPDRMLKQLQCVQNRAANMICKKKTPNTGEKLKLINWLPVKLMRDRISLMTLYKMKTQHNCPYFESFLNSKRLQPWEKVPVYEANPGRLLARSFFVRTVEIWNEIPESIRKTPPKQMKKAITNYVRSQF